MSWSLGAACLWLVVANLRAMFPSKDNHWRFAYGMIAVGVPLLIWIYLENGFWWALIALLCAAWVMRWPVLYLWRWVKRQVAG